MAVSFVASTVTTGYIGSVPAGVANGDLMIAVAGWISAGSIVGPAGWTAIPNCSPANGGSGGNTAAAMWYRIAASEPASYTWSTSGGATDFQHGVIISAYRGATVVEASQSQSATSGGSVVTPSVTTTNPADWLIRVYVGGGTNPGLTLPAFGTNRQAITGFGCDFNDSNGPVAAGAQGTASTVESGVGYLGFTVAIGTPVTATQGRRGYNQTIKGWRGRGVLTF